jgi:hypothetical protein
VKEQRVEEAVTTKKESKKNKESRTGAGVRQQPHCKKRELKQKQGLRITEYMKHVSNAQP